MANGKYHKTHLGLNKFDYKKKKEYIEELKEFKENLNKKSEILKERLLEDPNERLKVPKNYWYLQSKALEMFVDDKCFICDKPVKIDFNNNKENNARMINLTNSCELKKDDWITICKKCLKQKLIFEVLGLNK